MPRSSGLITTIQVGAIVILAAGIGCFLLVLATEADLSVATIATAALLLLLALGVASGLWALAALLRRDVTAFPPDVSRLLGRMQAQLDTVSTRLLEVNEQAQQLTRAQQAMQAYVQAVREQPMGLTGADLEPLHQSLREVRELTMLTDAERRERLDRYRQDHRSALVKQAFDLVSARQWHNAERLVLQLETEYPSDHDVAKARNYLNHARRLNEEETVARTVREVEDLLANASWDHALSRARALVEGFPDNGTARELMQRVQRERDSFYESTVARMFDELRHDIDRRMWRRAHMHAQHLLERFPAHPRADAVRRQLKTLQDNAEIEERQEIEVRIQELIKAQRFDEAIALGEDLIRRYPMSPQAESLDVLLPRLRELSEHGPQETAIDEYVGDEQAGDDGSDVNDGSGIVTDLDTQPTARRG